MYFMESHNISAPWERPLVEAPTVHKCNGCRERMIPVERKLCRTCRPKAPRPGYAKVDVRQSAFQPIATIAETLTQLGLMSGGEGR